ncbi:HK97 gp10 family phage protein [Nocardiopsis dassonvillei]|uniref:HK97 gp10 family phage protein n=1 Tax=Nocardiopsis dassonvillei TaxID=2014 RepID=UPI0020A4131F|nr:HK97 gp10 family phage protein [Nocardiopsis dassonvillei]MCP3017302.1 HK97 gp10 family phage protein [Nocardiopsis dassonvillei]
MAKRPSFRPNNKGIGQILASKQMEAAMVQAARGLQTRAEALAQEHRRTGEYLASFSISSTTRGGVKGDRAEAVLRNTSPHATLVEWGGQHMDAQRIMGRAAGEVSAKKPKRKRKRKDSAPAAPAPEAPPEGGEG